MDSMEQQAKKLNGLRNDLTNDGIRGWTLGTNQLHGARPTAVLYLGVVTAKVPIQVKTVNATMSFLVAHGYKPDGITQKNRATVHTFVHTDFPAIMVGIHRTRVQVGGEMTVTPYYAELYFGELSMESSLEISQVVKTIMARLSAETASSINLNPAHKGLLHKHLGIPEDEEIPVARLHEAMKSDNPDVRREANFALNARDFKH